MTAWRALMLSNGFACVFMKKYQVETVVSLAKRSFALASICGCSAGGTWSAQSNTSASLLSTCSASVCVFVAILTFTSTWPAGMPGTVLSVQFGLRRASNERFGTTFLTMYGPTPGGGELDRFVIFVPCGTK